MLKKILIAVLMAPLVALAQSYPSPTYQNLTVLGTYTGPVPSGIALSNLAAQAANTVVANATSSSHTPTAVSVPSCSTTNSALQYMSGTGFSCLTTSAVLGANTFTAAQTIGYSNPVFTINDTSGVNAAQIFIQSNGSNVWGIAKTSPGANNAFQLQRYNAGSQVDTPISVSNSTGVVSMVDGIQSNGGINNTPIGNTTANTGSFTTLAASSTVSGSGFTSLLSPYAPLASPALTGTPTAPTATVGTNTTQIATTAFVIANAGAGRLLNVQRFTSSGTYTPTAGTNSIIVEIQGGGGAGGGAPATSSGQVSAASGGAAGGYVMHRMTSGFSGATVTVGSGGAGSAGAGGGAGGNSAFAGITANGGGGGTTGSVSTTVSNPAASIGGAASGGSILNIPGASSTAALEQASPNFFMGGAGANSVLGSGASYVVGTTGAAATGNGAGGGGTFNGASAAAQTGGAGSAGLVIVWEYN